MGVSYLLLGFNLLLSGRSQQQVVWLLGPRFSPSTGCLAWPLSLMGSLTASGGCYSNKQFFVNPCMSCFGLHWWVLTSCLDCTFPVLAPKAVAVVCGPSSTSSQEARVAMTNDFSCWRSHSVVQAYGRMLCLETLGRNRLFFLKQPRPV